MVAELDRLRRPLRKLRQFLKRLPKDPLAEDVHRLRTEIRRAEATMTASALDHEKDGRRLIKSLRIIRKASGHVRDMDVLLGFASTLASDRPDECLARLLQHLGRQRMKSVSRFCGTLAAQRKKARRRLKRCLQRIEKDFAYRKAPGTAARRPPSQAAATVLRLSNELRRWPRLNRKNIHPFRLKVKALGYVLQLAEHKDKASAKFLVELGNVKDLIGEWHDWNELAAVAAEELSDAAPCDLLKRIEGTAKQKLTQALAAANALRATYLQGDKAGQRRNINGRPRLAR